MEYPFKERVNEVLPPLLLTPKSETKFIKEEIIDCLKCDESFVFPKLKDEYLAHLFLKHRFVIADVDDIADLGEYLKYWIPRLKDHDLEVYCTTMLLDQLHDGALAKNGKYYLLSDILPEDYELRKQLRYQRLEKALSQHQFERTDREFQKECLYCRDVIKGLRAEYLEHLFKKHFLQLGKPENLVYVDELIARVHLNLEQLVCIYCEKVFKDRVTLKDHMRKKAHKRINPNNRSYDKYFLINYRSEEAKATKLNKVVDVDSKRYQSLENYSLPTKSLRKQAARRKDIQEKQSVMGLEEHQANTHFDKHFENSGSDSDWSDWDGAKQPPLTCLYCTHKEPEFLLLKAHMCELHHVDFDASVKGMNFYQKVKIVNYLRRQICLQRCVTCDKRFDSHEVLLEHMSTEKHFGIGNQKQWGKPEYFFPTYDDDGVLCVLDDSPNDDMDDNIVPVISEKSVAKINKDAERLSLENFNFL